MTTIDHDLPYANVPESAIAHRFPQPSQFISKDRNSSQSISGHGSVTSRRKSRSSRDIGSSFHAEVERGLEKLQAQLQQEKRRSEIAEKRAEDAERKLDELTAHLKVINDARLEALREAGRANEELKLYRIQLDTAQREIYRAQDVIGIVDKQRLVAEKDAAKSRTRARELNERLLMESAKNEAYQLGLQEGLNRGRELAFVRPGFAPNAGEGENGPPAQGHYNPGESPSLSSQNDDSESLSMRPDASPASALNSLPPVLALPTHDATEQQDESLAPIPGPSNPPTELTSVHPSMHPSQDIRPSSLRNVSHTPKINSAFIPPDNFIPSLDADNRIRIPPPFEFHRTSTPERQPSPQLPVLSDINQEPIPIPPRSNIPGQRKGYHHARNSSSDSNSSSLSQLELINSTDFFGGLRTPMTMIPEVNSAYTSSPNPHSEDGHGERADHTANSHFSASKNMYQSPQTSSIRMPADNKSHRRSRPRSWMNQQRTSEVSSLATLPDISIQPPSQPVSSRGDSLHGDSRAGSSPSTAHRASSLSPVHEDPSKTPYS
ncbi:hypothetical protein CPB84DRAFT_1844332 [Gymnopilus junonius]|uniref:Uncharacterized protein n=1 Tax=Gymnopilus junonius TaxID=109634 RepID=A0A9P5NW02_GYMJU|nr:hypothetical protein CPB84DRAFT_1844332 [Gymnopilus junonius]